MQVADHLRAQETLEPLFNYLKGKMRKNGSQCTVRQLRRSHEGKKLIGKVVDFFNHVNMLYGTISEFCTPTEVSYEPHVTLGWA